VLVGQSLRMIAKSLASRSGRRRTKVH
jgi:hypothetical protein